MVYGHFVPIVLDVVGKKNIYPWSTFSARLSLTIIAVVYQN